MSMLVLMLRFYLPLLRIDLRQQPDMLMLVMASVTVLLMLVMMSRFFPPFWGLIRASRIRWRIYQSWSKDRGGSTRRPTEGSQHTFLQKGRLVALQKKMQCQSSFLRFPSLWNWPRKSNNHYIAKQGNLFFHISHWYLSWNTIDKSKSQNSVE